MVASQDLVKKGTNVVIKNCGYIPVDQFLAEFQLCPLSLYSRGKYPESPRVQAIATSLVVNDDTVVVFEAVNYFELTQAKIQEWNLKDVEPGKYLINGNTRRLGLELLKSEEQDLKFTDILIQEIDISESTMADLYDLQKYFNNETVPHTRFENIRALAQLITMLKSQGIPQKNIVKICGERKGVTPTDAKNAKNFFLEPKYKKEDLELVLALIEKESMAFDTAVVLLDLVNNKKLNLELQPSLDVIIAENNLNLEGEDKNVITRAMVYAYRDNVISASLPSANTLDGADDDEQDETDDENSDDDDEEKDENKANNNGTKSVLTEAELRQKKLEKCSNLIGDIKAALSDELAHNGETPDQITLTMYKNSIAPLTILFNELAPKLDPVALVPVFMEIAGAMITVIEQVDEDDTIALKGKLQRLNVSLSVLTNIHEKSTPPEQTTLPI